jgi:DNA replication protein DnaC
MTAFLKIDRCTSCHQESSWEWVPPIPVNGKSLAGTGVWRSQLLEGQCPACFAAIEAQRQQDKRVQVLREGLIQLLGGEKPYREFTFEQYEVTPGNRLAFERAKSFNPRQNNLYLWGPCGMGKTHLAYAIARTGFEQGRPVMILRPSQLTRKVRMRDPRQEQETIDGFVRVEVLILDDLGIGNDTAYARQILQEILDARDFQDRGGLVITGKYSLSGLAQTWNEDTIPSRLAGMCQIVEIKGVDGRLPSQSPNS